MSIARRELAVRVLLVLGSCAAALLLLELPALFRLVDYRNAIGANPMHSNYVDDPELLSVHRPHSRLSGSSKGGFAAKIYAVPLQEQTDYHWDVQYDRNGFRNATDLRRADTVVLGDSFVEGTTIPEAQLMTSLLAKARGEVVANFGHNGYGPQQELAVLRRYGLELRPRTAIWVFSEASDIGDAELYAMRSRRVSNFWLAFLDRSFTKNALEQLRPRTKLQPAAKGRGVLHNAKGTEDTYFTFADTFSAEPLPRTSFPGWQETIGSVQTAADLCAALGCRLVFVYAPDKFRALQDFCTFPADSEWRNRKLNDMPARMKAAIESISPAVEYLDLTPALKDDIRSGPIPYATDDSHWNAEGYRVAANAVADYLSTHADGRSGGAAPPREN